MLFKDLKNDQTLYVFDREKIDFTHVRVVDVVPPHFDNHYGNPTEMVVDVTIEGFQKPYTFKGNSDVGYIGNLVISADKEKVLREVEAVQAQSEQAWEKRDYYKEVIDKCAQIRANHSPAFKAKKETEERFTRLEDSVSELKDMLKGLVKELKG